MSRVDLYLIPAAGPQNCLLFACRLLEKAYLQQHKIYIHMQDAEKAHIFDELLWTFREDSFIPHALCEQAAEPLPPIQIGYTAPTSNHTDILLNMQTDAVPAFYSQFSRILEIMPNDATMQAVAQEHRVYYEENGYKVNIHNM